VLWSLWLARNTIVLKDKKFSTVEVFHRVKVSLGNGKKMQSQKKPKAPSSPIKNPGMAQGRFDGATTKTG
jgi:hypothetical protein